MPAAGTTVGPLDEQTRNRFREWKEEQAHQNYNEALNALLEEVEQ